MEFAHYCTLFHMTVTHTLVCKRKHYDKIMSIKMYKHCLDLGITLFQYIRQKKTDPNFHSHVKIHLLKQFTVKAKQHEM